MKEANFQNKIAEIIAESKRVKQQTNEVSRDELNKAISDFKAKGGTIKKQEFQRSTYDEWRYCPTYANKPLGWNPGRGAE